ncbi:PRC-barrel domain-containing protein [Streptomyces sp. HMX87]|uniref:PRC-barrel domain-containing protein n=1 Tax=Streptomyces sp. HMX87 TaxID=3390849 RepID=UPI003A84DF20
MTTGPIPTLKKISESDQAVAAPEHDVRGRKVVNGAGDELGKIGDLLIDEEERKVRFLLVEHGGFLGMGEKKTFIPVDAVTHVADEYVEIGSSQEQVTKAPEYDPELADESGYYDSVYTHYGFPPFWGPGYVYPPYPYYR